MQSPTFYLFYLLASLTAFSWALPTADSPTVAAPAVTPAPETVNIPAVRTVVRSTTQTSVTHPLWIPATVVTIVTTQTQTTIIPEQTADAEGPVLETVVGRTTYEYRMGYSDGHSSTSWSSATRSYVMTVG